MTSTETRILLVEDSATHAAIIREALASDPRPVNLTVAQSLAEARAFLRDSTPDLAIIDLLLPDGKGIELLPATPEEAPYPSLIMTSHGDEQAAVEAMKAGVLDYVVKSAAALANMPRIVERALREWSQIVERRRAEKALEASEQRFRSFFESSASGMAILSPEGRALQVNPTLCRASGYSEAEALGRTIFEVTHPDDREQIQRIFGEILSGHREIVDFEQRFLRKDGSILWGRVTVAGVYGPEGALSYFATTVQNITESKRAQDQIRQSQQMLQLVLDYIPQHVFWKDRDFVIRGCNRNFARAAGFEKPKDLIGKTDYDLPWRREEADFYRECDRRVMAADEPELHIIESQLQASGKEAWLDTNKIPLHDEKGRVVGILGTFEDITERKRAEEALVKANRELDAFVYTVSHDLRIPLTPIIGYAEFLHETCRDRLDEQSLECLTAIEAQGRRMLALLEDLLTLAKVGQVKRPAVPVDLEALMDRVLVDMGSLIAEAEVTVERSSLPGLRFPMTLLAQVFENLVGNAIRYAGRQGSPIEIGGERKGDLVQLYVRDHGPGIAEEERGRIFEVFYRGANGKQLPGTGVGLATVQKIARLFGGRAWVEETPGGGCTFRVEILDAPGTAENDGDRLVEEGGPANALSEN